MDKRKICDSKQCKRGNLTETHKTRQMLASVNTLVTNNKINIQKKKRKGA